MKRLAGVSFFVLLGCLLYAQVPKILIGPDGQNPRGTAWHPQFHGISIGDVAMVEIVVGMRPGLYVDGKRVKAKKVEHGVLHLDEIGDYKIVVTNLDLIVVREVADITFLGVDCDTLTITIKGACDATLAGRVRNLVVDVDGAADLFADRLRASTARVTVRGAADAYLWVTGRLYVDVKGVGDVTYRGNPWKIKTNISGVGDVKKRR